MRGLTLVETLVAIVIVAILTSLAMAVSSSEPSRTAMEIARLLRLHRFAAAVGGATVTCVTESPGPRSTAVAVHWPARGLMFTPGGLPRTCDGGGVGNTTILLEHRGDQAAVIVSSLGRVRWEMR